MKWLTAFMLIVFAIAVMLLIVSSFIYTQHPLFGKSPSGERLQLIENSPNYRQGQFRNLIEKSGMSEGCSMVVELYKTFIQTIPHRNPIDPIPSIKTNLKTLNPQHDVMVWCAKLLPSLGAHAPIKEPIFIRLKIYPILIIY